MGTEEYLYKLDCDMCDEDDTILYGLCLFTEVDYYEFVGKKVVLASDIGENRVIHDLTPEELTLVTKDQVLIQQLKDLGAVPFGYDVWDIVV